MKLCTSQQSTVTNYYLCLVVVLFVNAVRVLFLLVLIDFNCLIRSSHSASFRLPFFYIFVAHISYDDGVVQLDNRSLEAVVSAVVLLVDNVASLLMDSLS